MNSILKTKVQDNEMELVNNAADKKIVTGKIDFFKEQLKKQTVENDVEIERLEKLSQSHLSNIGEIGVKCVTLETENTKLSNSVLDETKVKDELEKLTAYQTTFKVKHKNIEKNYKFFHDTKTCPTCTQAIDEDFKSSIINESAGKLDQLQVGLDKVENTINKVKTKLKGIEVIKKKINIIIVSQASQSLR